MTDNSTGVTFHRSASADPSEYLVRHGGVIIGTVARFQMGAGQFGQSWVPTAQSGKRSTLFKSRGDSAAWLVKQAGS